MLNISKSWMAEIGLRHIAVGNEVVSACIVAMLFTLVATHGVRAESGTIQTRPGVTVPTEIDVPQGAKAIVLIFEGGGGNINSRGFASSVHESLEDAGVGAVSIGAPSDQRGFMGGMSPLFRSSNEHLADIDAVIRSIKSAHNLPVWVFGVSLGSRSAAGYAVRRANEIAGLIVASSSTNPPRGKPIQDFQLGRLQVPVLAIAHEDDSCRGTPPSGAQLVVNAASSSPKAEVRVFSGGDSAGKNPCGIRSYHTFYRIESEVGRAIADFIKSNTS